MASHATLLMKLTGASSGWIKGESENENFVDHIEVTDWSLNVQRKQANGDPEPSVLSLSKLMDRASTAMLGSMRNGEPFDAVLTMEDRVGEYFHLVITLTKLRFTFYSFDAESEDASGEVKERWRADYETVEFAYRDDAKKGLASVTLKRPPGASTDAPAGNEEKIIDLAREMEPGSLPRLFERMKQAAEEAKFKGKDATRAIKEGPT